MTPLQFVEKWKPVTLSERAAAQSHFCDLCRLLDHPDPVSADPTGDWFTFEKGVSKSGGGDGFADVWKRDFFAWEYKKKKRNLDEALGQLARYALALENPPLHVACDTDRFRIVTAWTNTVPRSFELALDDLLVPNKLDILRSVFFQPEALKPGETREDLTKAAADKFSSVATKLQGAGNSPDDIAHFITRLVFLFFAEDVRLLPKNYFRRILLEMSDRPKECTELLDGLFAVLRKGGRFGVDRLPHVNGGLFDDRLALSLDASDVALLVAAGSQNWAHIDPTIFGTLFERLLDPDKRSQIGAHYTDAAKIMMILEPVIFRPLKQEWNMAKKEIETLVSTAATKGPRAKEWAEAERRRSIFFERLRTVSVLDAACGSGNFLYLALQGIKNIEHVANQECEVLGLSQKLLSVGPEIIHGIEINPLAAELARTTIWIGDIQWSIQNGIYSRPEPILRPLETIQCRDALITKTTDGKAVEAKWPHAEFIVGNPPFLGGKLIRNGLGNDGVKQLFEVYGDRVPGEADLVCYWFEKARASVKTNQAKRVGLVATNSIRGGVNRKVLEQIVGESRIFEAWSDQPWVIDGANVRVSLICFGDGDDRALLDGQSALSINADLTRDDMSLIAAQELVENSNKCFQGIVKVGSFDVPGDLARAWLRSPLNPNGRPNTDVVRPWMNGSDIVRRPSDYWIIDFGEMTEREAAHYQLPFEYVVANIKSERIKNRDKQRSSKWWRLGRSGGDVRSAIKPLTRCIVTPRVAKYRIFAWASPLLTPDSAIVVIARDDDVTFGILQSRFHTAWSLRLGSSLEDRPRYTPTTTFETFPFPIGMTPNIPANSFQINPKAMEIARLARRLNDLRNSWLNPSDLVNVEPEVVAECPERLLPKNAEAERTLHERTLTRLYNIRPQWLIDAHNDLDAAVASAYGWPSDISEEGALSKLIELNMTRIVVQAQGKKGKRPTPQELWKSPQFRLPIPGGKSRDELSAPVDSAQKIQRILSPRKRRNLKREA